MQRDDDGLVLVDFGAAKQATQSMLAVSEHQIVDEDLDHFNAGFADWVRQANPIVPSHADWVKMIQMYTVSRQESMIQFFDLLDKYRLAAGKELTDPEAKFIRLSSSDYP